MFDGLMVYGTHYENKELFQSFYSYLLRRSIFKILETDFK